MKPQVGSVIAGLSLLWTAVLSGCASLDEEDAGSGFFGRPSRFAVASPPRSDRLAGASGINSPDRRTLFEPYRDEDGANDRGGAGGGVAPKAIETDENVFTLNFVDVDLQEFVRMFFDEIMEAPVIVDPSLGGRITVRTRRPVSRQDAIKLARGLLAMNGARLVEREGAFQVSSDAGSSVDGPAEEFQVHSLRHVDAEQLRSALGAFGAEASRMTVLGERLLLVAGSQAEIERFQRVAGTLDVDRLSGRVFSLRPMRSASARSAASELSRMFSSNGNGAFTAMAIERMNAILMFGSSAATIRRAEAWLGKLDQGGDTQRRVHVYPVQNRSATEIASVLQAIVSGLHGASTTADAPATPSPDSASDIDPTTQFSNAANGGSPTVEPTGRVAVSADPTTNSLIIVAEDEEYELLRKAIDRLDVVPAQVLVEATIAEVTLNSALNRGVRWYFETGNHGFNLSGEQGLEPGPEVPGFNYMFTVPSARVVISALEGVTNVEIISSPALMVLDNQLATLKIGDQVPIAVRSVRSSETSLAPIVNEIEMRDTGIVLAVKPRISPSGMVQLDISQEISDVVATTTSSISSPTIRQRAITSSIVVQSGTDIVLGGLIATKSERSRSGVPVLKDIPLLGEVFTTRDSRSGDRTELLIIMRPVVLSSTADVNGITAEIRSKMLMD